MIINILLMLVSALLTVIGTLLLITYRDMARRLVAVERKQSAMLSTLLAVAMHITPLPADAIEAIRLAIQ